MGKIILEGGTDIAEMAVFCSDSMPSDDADERALQLLEKENALVRMPTGADGGYLLYLYVDENIDERLLQYCVKDDPLESELIISNGNISFGGIESAVLNFEENKYIRSDAKLTPGAYSVLAYHTDYPDELVENKLSEEVGDENLKYVNFPSYVTGLSVVTIFILVIAAINANMYFGLVALILSLLVYSWRRKYINSSKYITIEKSIKEIQQEFPSIVMQLKLKTS